MVALSKLPLAMAVRGTAQIQIVLKGENVPLILEVAIINGLTKELIMGIDVLDKLCACIDLKRRYITLDRRFTFPLDIGNEFPTLSQALMAQYD